MGQRECVQTLFSLTIPRRSFLPPSVSPPHLGENDEFFRLLITVFGCVFRFADPRGFLSSLQKKENLTPDEQAVVRAEAAQQNGFENIALFATAIVRAHLSFSLRLSSVARPFARRGPPVPILPFQPLTLNPLSLGAACRKLRQASRLHA